jgi:CBS-domain-containing membrane protein
MDIKNNLIDENFKKNRLKYILQCFAAASIVFFILLLLNFIFNALVIAAFGATSFIAFTMPKMEISKPRCLIGGYIVGITCGWLGDHLSGILGLLLEPDISLVISASIIVGLAIFIMVIINAEHAPATAIALGFVLDGFNIHSAVAVILAVILLVIIKEILKKHMINLL